MNKNIFLAMSLLVLAFTLESKAFKLPESVLQTKMEVKESSAKITAAEAEIQTRMLEFLNYLLAADHTNYATYLADSTKTVMIGSSPEEWYEGYDNILTALAGYTAELAFVNARIISSDIKAHVRGPIGWAATPLTMRVTIDGVDIDIEFRITATWSKICGVWQVIQWHDSIASTLI